MSNYQFSPLTDFNEENCRKTVSGLLKDIVPLLGNDRKLISCFYLLVDIATKGIELSRDNDHLCATMIETSTRLMNRTYFVRNLGKGKN